MLGTLNQDGAGVTPALTASANSVVITPPLQGSSAAFAGAVTAAAVTVPIISDGSAVLTKGSLTATTVRAGSLTDGVAVLSNGSLTVKNLNVLETFTVASLDAANVSVRPGGSLSFMHAPGVAASDTLGATGTASAGAAGAAAAAGSTASSSAAASSASAAAGTTATPAPWRFVVKSFPGAASSSLPALIVQCWNPVSSAYVDIQTFEPPMEVA